VAISLDTTATSGNLTLSRNNIKFKVFTAVDGGTEIGFDGIDNVFDVATTALPKYLYVEGAEASANMRDVSLTLTHDETSESDEVRFTVLWVTVTTKHSGNVANDNSARATYHSFGVPPSYALGFRLEATSQIAFTAINSEFIGDVAPSDFQPSVFGGTLKLDREIISSKYWWGANGNENSTDFPTGPDTSGDSFRDDDPQSGGSSGRIYDIDGPWLNVFSMDTPNVIIRKRSNYKQWAVYGTIRCSTKIEWCHRQSIKLSGVLDGGTVDSATADSVTDSDKSWTADSWTPGVIRIAPGTGTGQVRKISGNTATTVTVSTAWTVNPDDTSEFLLQRLVGNWGS
jgi:hypothetical protein